MDEMKAVDLGQVMSSLRASGCSRRVKGNRLTSPFWLSKVGTLRRDEAGARRLVHLGPALGNVLVLIPGGKEPAMPDVAGFQLKPAGCIPEFHKRSWRTD